MTCTATSPRSRPSSTTRAQAPTASSSAATTRSSAAGRRRPSSGCATLPDALWIRGNGERWTATPTTRPTTRSHRRGIEAARAALGPQLVADLAALPADATRGDTLICHGSPASDVRSFLPEPADDEAELLDGVTATRLIFGHTHLPFRRHRANGIELVNPGSVGMPFDGDPRAAYALVHDDGTIEHRRVAYDHEASAAQGARTRHRVGRGRRPAHRTRPRGRVRWRPPWAGEHWPRPRWSSARCSGSPASGRTSPSAWCSPSAPAR